MKKILLAIFGAAFLMVGCTKELQTSYEDMNTRVTTLEELVAQNQKAIAALQAAVQNQVGVVSCVENAAGYLITLSNGQTIQLNHGQNGQNGQNGTNGKDGDSFFSSVVIEGGYVVITMVGGGTYQLPYVGLNIAFEKSVIDIAPGLNVIPYTIENGSENTQVYAMATPGYFAEIDAEASELKITAPIDFVRGYVWVDAIDKGILVRKQLDFAEAPFAIVSDVEAVAVEGGTIDVPVVSNVEIEILDETEDWLSYKETKATTYTVVLTAQANNGAARSSSVKVLRKSDKLVLQTITVAQEAQSPVILNGTQKFNTIADALAAAKALTEGTATLTLGEYDFPEVVKVNGGEIAVPVIIDGQNLATITGGIETYKNATTIKNLTIVVGTNKSTLGGEYSNTAHDSGIHITEAGYGVLIDNIVFNNTLGDATSVYVAGQKTSAVKDVVKNCKFGGEGQRAMQIYGGPVDVLDNEFTAAYGSYAMRVGNKAPATVIAGNKFNCTSTAAVNVHSSLAAGGTITFGDGLVDTNEYAAGIANVVNGGTDNAVTILPAAYATLPVANSAVKFNGMPVASLQAAVAAAAELAAGTAEIKIAEGTTVTEEVAIDGADVTVPVIIDGGAPSTTLVGSIELQGVKATIRNLTINPTAESKTSLAKDGWQTLSDATFGIAIDGSGFGCLLENLTINPTVDYALGIWSGTKKGVERDVIKNVTINGSGNAGRHIEAYNSIIEINGCTFNGSSAFTDAKNFSIEFAGTEGTDAIIKGCRFNSAAKDDAAAILFFSFAWGNVVLGDGLKNDNTQDGSFRSLLAGGNEWLFVNKNFFYPDLAYSGTGNDVVVYNETLSRVWAKWDEFDNDWDDAILPQTTGNNWDRHGVASGRYLYIPISQGALANSGIAVFDVLTGEYLYKITDGILDKGHFKVCSTAKLGETVYVASMSGAVANQNLLIYKLTTASPYFTKAEVVLDVPCPAGVRLGDTMTGYGTDAEGILAFVSYGQTGEQRPSYLYQVVDGVITNADAPYCPAYMNTPTGNKMLGLYFFAGETKVDGWHYALLSGNNPSVMRAVSEGWYNVELVTGTKWADFAANGIFNHCVLDPTLITLGGKQHLAYVTVSGHTASLRLVDISAGEGGVVSRIDALGDADGLAAKTIAYGIAYPSNIAAEGPNAVNNNSTGFLTTTKVDDVTYIIAGATEAGISCFKVN